MIKQVKILNSSQIEEVRYEPGETELYVKFKRGSWYKYKTVPEEVYEGFLVAPSAGKYLAESIKGKYQCAMMGKEDMESKCQ